MKIEQSVIRAVYDVTEGCLNGLVHAKPEELAQAAISAYLKSIWHKFDASDKSTWPSGEEYEYICLTRRWKGKMIVGKAWQIDKWDTVLAWIEPADILGGIDVRD